MDPPSLEDQCFLYIACTLDGFPVESLALLPVRLREKLLVNLPAIDVCRLEERSCFTRGVDSDAVWKAIFSRGSVTLGSFVQNEMGGPGRAQWKERYLTFVTDLVLNYSISSDRRYSVP